MGKGLQKRKKTVAVFFGGRSNEREISVITGTYAANLLRAAGYRVLPVYLNEEDETFLAENVRGPQEFARLPALPPLVFRRGGLALARRPGKTIPVDAALNCCHGGAGEGGVLSALLSFYKIPSASPDAACSAVFLDKCLTKIFFRGMGIACAPGFFVREGEDARERAKELGFPLVVKPSKLGSSIGVSVVRSEEELEKALALAFRLDGAALVEKYLTGKRDLNCAVYRANGKLVFSPVEEVFSSEPILTFGEKYESAGERSSAIPADIAPEQAEAIRSALERAYEQFDANGVVRGDFLLADGKIYFNELNTVPGTLSTHLFGERLTEAREMLTTLVENARTEREREIVDCGVLRSPALRGKGRKLR